jgi:outer membrane lipoprotein-sorting protein
MLLKKKATFCILLLALSAVYMYLPVCGVGSSTSGMSAVTDSSFTRGFLDGKAELDTLYKTAENFTDYTYDSQFTLHKAKGQDGSGSFFFKKVDQMRVQVKTAGPRNGTVVVKQADGKIRMAGGNLLKFLKMNLSPDSRLLMLPNGYNVIKSDLVSLLSGVKNAVTAGSQLHASPEPIAIDRFRQKVEVLEVTKPKDSAEQLTDRIFVNPDTNVPIAWDVFREGNLFSTVTFDNFRGNVGLKDDLFKL